jgi:hypothetical protein
LESRGLDISMLSPSDDRVHLLFQICFGLRRLGKS